MDGEVLPRRYAISADGVWFAKAKAFNVSVYRDGSLVKSAPIKPRDDTRGEFNDVALSHDNKLLAAACIGGIVIWSLPDMEVVGYSGGNRYHEVEFHPSLPYILAFTSAHDAEVWSAKRFYRMAAYDNTPQTVGAYFAATGDRICFVRQQTIDDPSPAQRSGRPMVASRELVDVLPFSASPERIQLLGHQSAIIDVAWQPDGQLLATSCADSTLGLWDARTGRLKTDPIPFERDLQCVNVNRSGDFIAAGATAGLGLFLIDAKSRATTARIKTGSRIWALEFGPDEQTLVAGMGNGTILAWTIDRSKKGVSLKPLDQLEHDRRVTGIAVHPNGRAIAFQDLGGSLHRYRLRGDPEYLARAQPGYVTRIRFRPNGHLVFLTPGNELAELDWNTGNIVRRLSLSQSGEELKKPPDYYSRLDVSPDGSLAAINAAIDRLAIYDLKRQRLRYILPREAGVIRSYRFSHDLKRLAVGLNSGPVSIWNLGEIDARLAVFGVNDRPVSVAKPSPVETGMPLEMGQ